MKAVRSGSRSKFNTLNGQKSKKADNLHDLFKAKGVDFATGVPCGVLKYIIRNFSNDKSILHVPVNRESEAIGVAAGAYLSGRRPVVYAQNSGLFAASNDIASLLIPYEIPVFFVISYRGCKGEDAVQHLVTGQATETLICSFRLDYVVFEGQDIAKLINELFEKMEKRSLPVFLLLKRGWCR